jgi:hypothetical protein
LGIILFNPFGADKISFRQRLSAIALQIMFSIVLGLNWNTGLRSTKQKLASAFLHSVFSIFLLFWVNFISRKTLTNTLRSQQTEAARRRRAYTHTHIKEAMPLIMPGMPNKAESTFILFGRESRGALQIPSEPQFAIMTCCKLMAPQIIRRFS